jgi:hypothetical protein
MLEEMDIVKAKRQLSERVKANTEGTIVMIYDNPRVAYEVEFLDEKGDTLDLLTVEETDISKI